MTQRTVQTQTDWLRRAGMALAVVGAADSAYLTWVKLANTSIFCGGVGNCESVNASRYSEIGGVPIALLGLGSYLAILLLLALEPRGGLVRAYGPLAVFGLALTGTLYSAYLTYVEVFVINAICPYCVVSAVIITGILALSLVRLWRAAPGLAEAGQ